MEMESFANVEVPTSSALRSAEQKSTLLVNDNGPQSIFDQEAEE